MILAHRKEGMDKDGNTQIHEQSLMSHLLATGKHGGTIGKAIDLEATMTLIGYLHDLGKADRKFQNYIRGITKGQVNHSSAGVKIFHLLIDSNKKMCHNKEKVSVGYFMEVISYVVYGHHGLFDLVSVAKEEHNAALRYDYEDETYHFKEDVIPFAQHLSKKLKEMGEKTLDLLVIDSYKEIKELYKTLKKVSEKNPIEENRLNEISFYMGALMRLCLSILKEADIYDSSNAFNKTKQKLWSEEEMEVVWHTLQMKVEELYKKYTNVDSLSEINKARNYIAEEARKSALKNKEGIYKLEVPTGAGKTKTGLRYGITYANTNNSKRFFYVTAYLSVLEQNAEEIKNILEMDTVILEHHSNVIPENTYETEHAEDNEDYNSNTYLKESWENPIILTTMVQFLNTLFKDKSAQIRRFSKLIQSVVILDEVQSLPLKTLSLFNLMMNFMKTVMKCNIVHCTATQPILDSKAMNYPIYYGDKEGMSGDIIENVSHIKDIFERVEYCNLTGRDGNRSYSTKEIRQLVENELNTNQSCLIVLNTKKAVLTLYQYFREQFPHITVIYLTTNLCPAHRLKKISEIKSKLLSNRNEMKEENKEEESIEEEKIICISTRLIEAGVDLDFDVVIRSLAGIDSLVQCAGRCNREGKLKRNGRKVRGICYILRYENENLRRLKEIEETVEATEYALRSYKDNGLYDYTSTKNKETYEFNVENTEGEIVDISKIQVSYYNKYYLENQRKLDYIVNKNEPTLIELLGHNMAHGEVVQGKQYKIQKFQMYQGFKTAAETFELIGKETIGVIVPYENATEYEGLVQALEIEDDGKVKFYLRQLQRHTVNIYDSPDIRPYVSENKKYGIHLLLKEYYDLELGICMTALETLIV